MSEYSASYSGPSAGQIASAVRREILDDLSKINNNVITTQNQVVHVEQRIDTVDDKLQELEDELLSFVREQRMANRLGQAETRVVNIRQRLEKEFGHYEKIRRTVIGILEASDLALVRQNTITTASEELFLSTPHYWLAPCLVALAAWINDNEELAKKAVKEALRRNAENSSLFFALITRRAERFQPSLLWVQHYLAAQNEEDLNRNALIVLEALVCGIWGNDTEGVVSDQFRTWIDKLESRKNFYEEQVAHWKTALLNKRETRVHNYPYLKKYCPAWATIDNVLNGVELHETVNRYICNIFDTKITFPDFKTMLDESLTRLITNYDDEELPLRQEEQLESLVIKFLGNEAKAKAQMDSEEELFATRKNFLQLLLEAAMHPETHDVNMALTKFAVAVCKFYIYDAYNDIASTNRANLPNDINFILPSMTLSIPNVNSQCLFTAYNARTTNGADERDLIQRLDIQVERDRMNALHAAEKYFLSHQPSLAPVIGICIFIIMFLIITLKVWGILLSILVVVGGLFQYNRQKKKYKEIYTNETIPAIHRKYDEVKNSSEQIVRACCAESFDFYDEFREKDAKAKEFLDYIETLEGNEYIHVPAMKKRVIR